MREKRLFGGTMINSFWAKTHLPGLRRPWRLLAVCLAALGLLLALLGPAAAGDGALDPTFITGPGPYAGVQTIPEIRGAVGYNTGGPYNGYGLLFGTFWGLNVGGPGPNNNCIARLTNTGALDTTFLNNQQLNGEIRGVYIYPHDVNDPNSDKILIGGKFNAFSGSTAYANFARLNADGSLDTTFPQAFTSWDGSVNSFGVQGSGSTAKILVGGYNLSVGPEGPNRATYQLIRLNIDGSLDPTYTPWGAPGGYINSIKVFVNDPQFGNDVRIWCSYPKNQNGTGGTYYGLLLNANAARPDLTAPEWSIGSELVDAPVFNAAQESPDSGGKWIICGQFKNVYNIANSTWLPRNGVARFGADFRTLDTTYDVGVGPGGVVTQISPMKAIPPTLDPPAPGSYDDRMVLSGNFTTWNNVSCGCIVRLKTDATVDSTFNSGARADDRIQRLNWKADGTGGWVSGYFRYYNGQARGGITGVDSNGNPTSGYGNITAQAGWGGMVYSLATQSDGKIIIGGDFNGVGGKYRGGFARLNPNGSLDPSFRSHLDGRVMSVAVQGDGKILVGGQFGECQGYSCTGLARLNPNGSLDTAFKPMLVGGDNSMNSVNHVVPQSDGKIMIAGNIYNNTGSAAVARLNSNGSLDSDFFYNASHIPNPIPGADWVWGSRVALAGGKYVLAGGYDTTNTVNGGGFLGRLTGSGTLDPEFFPGSNNHVQAMDGPVDDLFLQPDGKIVVSGFFANITGGPARRAIARFSADGLVDTTFAPSLTPLPGANTIIINGMARESNGKILIEANSLNYVDDITWNFIGTRVTRLNSDGSLDSSFALGIPANGGYYPGGGNSILRLPNGKALIGGTFSTYNGNPAWSLVRIFAGPANYSPGVLLLLDY